MARREQAAATTLERTGLRATRQRVRVLAELMRERDDATAQELHERLRARGQRLGLATVYRTLNALACSLEPWLERASAAHGFVTTGHRLEVSGLCGDCRAAGSR
jgi:Fur family ferric uptake transcriptional regulator